MPAGAADCTLASECHLANVLQRNTSESGRNTTTLPNGWALRLKIAQSEYYPGLTAATFTTLLFSVGCSVVVALLMSNLVWQYNKSQGKRRVRLCCISQYLFSLRESALLDQPAGRLGK